MPNIYQIFLAASTIAIVSTLYILKIETYQITNPYIVQAKIIVEVLLLLHLISAFPIVVNPSNQEWQELNRQFSLRLNNHTYLYVGLYGV